MSESEHPRGVVATSKVKLSLGERRAKVWGLHLAGLGIRDIAKQVGISTNTVIADTKWCREIEPVAGAVEEVRRDELLRLNQVQASWWERAQTEIPAAGIVLKVMERKARLVGLDQPVQVQIDVARLTDAELDERYQVLVTQLVQPKLLAAAPEDTEEET